MHIFLKVSLLSLGLSHLFASFLIDEIPQLFFFTMSSIYKLSICGVRSFDPERLETIQFGVPLTLICGQNGCGKTTIIECLKYATTGDLPPNLKGGAFVHDPKLVFKQEVRAQVKLAFSNANGKSMICTRSMQLSKKRGRGSSGDTTTFKTLEGQLAIMNRGERSSISTKNAELDTQIPLYLGASKAVLDYVIFCHQDDSLWPLSEASVLKKRFDDIFEALKFTKVLDTLKVIRKDMSMDMKLYEQSVKHLKLDKDRAAKIKLKMESMEETIEVYTAEIADLTHQIEKVEAEADNLFKSNQEFQEVLSRLENLQMNRKSFMEQSQRLKNSIEELKIDDVQLLNQLNDFENVMNEKQAKIRQVENTLEKLTADLSSDRSGYNELIRTDATLRAKEQEYRKNIIEREEIMLLNTNYGPKTNPIAYLTNLHDDIGNLKSAYQELVASNKRIQIKLEEEARNIDKSIALKTQEQIHVNNANEEAQKTLTKLERDINALSYTKGNIEIEKVELVELEDKLKKLKNETDGQDIQKTINDKNLKLLQLEAEIDDIMKKIGASTRQSDIHAKLSLIHDSREKKEKSINSLISFHREGFMNEVGVDLVMDNCDALLNDKIKDLNASVDERDAAIEQVKKKISLLTSSLTSNEDILKEYKLQAQGHEKRIFEVIDEDQINTYEDLVKDLESNYRDSLDALNTLEVTKQFNLKAIEIGQKEKKCSLCYRAFDTPGLTNFVELLQEKIKMMSFEALSQDCEEAKVDLDSAKSINSDILQFRKLNPLISELEVKINNTVPQITEFKDDLSKSLAERNSLKSRVAKLTALQRPVSDILRMNDELGNIDAQLREAEEEINDFAGSALSIEELQNLQQAKSREIKSLREEVNEETDKKFSRQREISKFEGAFKDKKLKISNMEKDLMDRSNMVRSSNDIKEKIEKLQNQIEIIELDMVELNENKTKHESEIHAILKKHDVVNKVKLDELTLLEEFYKLLKQVTNFITIFENEEQALLRETSEKVEKLGAKIQETEAIIESDNKELKTLERVLNDSAGVFRNIQANLDYRHLLKEIDETERQIELLNVKNAEKMRTKYQEESKKLRTLSTNLNAKHAGKIGEVRQMQDQLKSYVSELEKEYKNIDDNYHKEWVKLQTNTLVADDIQTYSKALDNAIMKYHSIKMKDINRIIDELWKQTYKGSDVDTISIKSDVNLQAKGNRSYNYRVVMIKLGAELDMRGRCSAGQKVLASIIIRLALAECFGVNCGMIALDEPTTNLDVDNIESLADALNTIIEVRKKQKNFQLIIITHDEKFLSHINGDKFTNHFYRVQRDESQKSTIRSLPINLIQEE